MVCSEVKKLELRSRRETGELIQRSIPDREIRLAGIQEIPKHVVSVSVLYRFQGSLKETSRHQQTRGIKLLRKQKAGARVGSRATALAP